MVVANDSTSKGILWEFSQNTNMHGVGGWGRPYSCFIRKLFWIIITLAAVIVLSLWTRTLVLRYLDYDVEVNIEVLYKTKMVFPAVTICNLNPVRVHLMDALAPEDYHVKEMQRIKDDLRANFSTNPYGGFQTLGSGPPPGPPPGFGPPRPPPPTGFAPGPGPHPEGFGPGPPAPPSSAGQYPGMGGPPHRPPPPVQGHPPGMYPAGGQGGAPHQKKRELDQEDPFLPTKRKRQMPDMIQGFVDNNTEPEDYDNGGSTTEDYGSSTDYDENGSGSGEGETDDQWSGDGQDYEGDGSDYDDWMKKQTEELSKKVVFNESSWSSDEADQSYWEKMNSTNGMTNETSRAYILHKQFLENLAKTPPAMQNILGHQKFTMILGCGFKGYTCTPQLFERFWNYKYGNCYTFNSGWNKSEELLRANLPGPINGLSLELFFEETQYVKEITENTGMKVVIHSQDRMPFPEDEGLEVPPGYQTSVGVRMKEITRKPYPFPSNCHKNQGKEDWQKNAYNMGGVFAKYSNQACLKTCLQLHFMQNCDCGNVQFPLRSYAFRNVTKSWKNETKVCDSGNSTIRACMDTVSAKFDEGNLTCDCPQACSDTVYTTTNSMSKWPSRDYAMSMVEKLKKRNDFWKEQFSSPDTLDNVFYLGRNVLKLAIYYEDLNYESIRQVEAYGITALVSDFGGQMGLWMGLSVIALFEFIELLFDLVWFLTCRKKNKNEPPREHPPPPPPHATLAPPPPEPEDKDGSPGSRKVSPAPDAKPRYMDWYGSK